MQTTKYCSRCKQTKPLTEFYTNKAAPNGMDNYCKKCKKELKAEYRKNNKTKLKISSAKYYQENKDKIFKYRAGRSDLMKAYLKDYREKNRDKLIKDKRRAYRLAVYGQSLTDEELEAMTKDRYYYARKYGYRSGLEITIAEQLRQAGIDPKYEQLELTYQVPAKNHVYHPDFPVSKKIIIETKGRFQTADRMKMLMVQKQHPEYDFRFVFSNANAKISKVSNTTYGRWCEKNGFKYADKAVPQEWIEEILKEK